MSSTRRKPGIWKMWVEKCQYLHEGANWLQIEKQFAVKGTVTDYISTLQIG